MADGALFGEVVAVLRDAGVSVDATERPHCYRVSRGDLILVVRMRDVVSRTVVDQFNRSFSIPKAKFFPAPIRMVPKASAGEQPAS